MKPRLLLTQGYEAEQLAGAAAPAQAEKHEGLTQPAPRYSGAHMSVMYERMHADAQSSYALADSSICKVSRAYRFHSRSYKLSSMHGGLLSLGSVWCE